MKKIYRYSAIYALALTFALKTSSCSDFLQVEPTGSLTEEQVFEKIDNVEPLVLGLYKSYRGCKEGRNGLMPYLGTGTIISLTQGGWLYQPVTSAVSRF